MYRSIVFSTLILLFVSVNAFAQTTKSRTAVNNKQRSATTVTVQNSKTLAAAKKRGGSARAQTTGTQRKVLTTNRYNQNTNVVTDAPVKKHCGTMSPVSAGANTGYEVGRPAGYDANAGRGQVAAKPAAATSPAKARAGAARVATPVASSRRTGLNASTTKQSTPVSAKQRAGSVAVDARPGQ